MKKIMRDAGLSGAQIKQVESLHFEAERERVDIHHELAKARLELQRLLSADAPDDSAVFAQVDKIGALDTRLKKNRIGLLLKVRRLMTPEQWEKMQMARAAFRMRRGHPHAVPVPPMPPPPPPPP
jgi:Spy/CpxP family protein refolding chaperone